MKHDVSRIIGICAAGLLSVPLLGAQELATRLAARVELHPIQTVTLSDQQFLRGEESGGRSVTVGGEFRIAQGMGRLPVVVMIHGSGGVGRTSRPGRTSSLRWASRRLSLTDLLGGD